MTGFRDLELRDSYFPEDHPLTGFYVPALKEAVTYDRFAGYFRSSALAVAAAGIAHFIRAGGRMRMVVGAQLDPEDIRAIIAGDDLAATVAARMAGTPLDVSDALAERRIEALAWMVKEGRLEIKVGVPTDHHGNPLGPDQAGAYFHTKLAVLTDADGNRIAFKGSTNETAAAWRQNYEQIDVYRSWDRHAWERWGAPLEERFKRYWNHRPNSGWAILDLPEAVRDDLVKRAPPPDWKPPRRDPLEAEDETLRSERDRKLLDYIQRAPALGGGTGVGISTAPVVPYPHQRTIVRRAVETFPRGYLLADEVGLGKTIEAGLILRELLLTERAATALLLVPASVIKQWQQELYERIALPVPRYDGGQFLDHRDRELQPSGHSSPWSAFPVVLASSHLARRAGRREEVIQAGPWDVVLVDEAHHARRRSKEASDRNALLRLLREMKAAKSWRALYLASATPMQMNAYEAWDLLSLFDLPGRWGERSEDFVRYYAQLREQFEERDWNFLSDLSRDYGRDKNARQDLALAAALKEQFGMAGTRPIRSIGTEGISQSVAATLPRDLHEPMDRWLRSHTPMRDRVFRTTRETLRRYKADGLLPSSVNIPHREVKDQFIEMTAEERALYERIETYISRFYNLALQATGTKRKALGFIMTVYRRRLTSSFEAVQLSLARRLKTLEDKGSQADLLDSDDLAAVEGSAQFEDESAEPAGAGEALKDEIGELRAFLNELDKRHRLESKMEYLVNDLKTTFDGQHDTVVIFTQYTDTMDYIRQQLVTQYREALGCYSGRGGERWDPDENAWRQVTKEEIKHAFREGEIKVLIGTDSMSEGLNLQTCGRLINYDMPWNFMRVEQRIGRVDRIGGKARVEVTNYFYEGTVEEQIYRGIAKDFAWFEDVVGPAQPVLRQIEGITESLAMQTPGQKRLDELNKRIEEIRKQMDEAAESPVTLDDMTHEEPVPSAQEPAIDLRELEVALTKLAPSETLIQNPELPGSYLLTAGEYRDLPVTFRPQVFEAHSSTVSLMTYLSHPFQVLLDTLTSDLSGTTESTGDATEPVTDREEFLSLI